VRVGVLVVSILISFTPSDRLSEIGVQRQPRLVVVAAEITCFNFSLYFLSYCIFYSTKRWKSTRY